MTRESIVFYRSFYEAIEQITDAETKVSIYKALFEYALNGNEIEVTGIAAALFTAFKPQIDKNNKRYENGLKGGRKPNQTITKEEPKKNQTETKPKPKKVEPVKNEYGEYKNVRLTEDEYKRLNEKFGEASTQRAVVILDTYIESLSPAKKREYLKKNHNLCMQNWVYSEVEKRGTKPVSKNTFNNFTQNQYTHEQMQDLEAQLLDN